MTTKQQGKLLVNRTRKMYYYLEKNDPAKAQCMEDRFLGELNDKESTEGFKVFVGQVKGVPKERREKSYLEDLLAYYISEELCGDVTSKNTTP